MRSSTTTNIIAPAANARNHGCAAVRFAARKYPITANTGSTAPLPMPYKKALPRLPVAVFMGRETAAPSGKFCIAIPTARPSAETNAPCSPSAAAANSILCFWGLLRE